MEQYKYHDSTPLGRFLRESRLNAGLTLEGFGQLIGGFSKTMVSKWERGINTPSTKNLRLIADQLNIEVSNLIALSEPTNSVREDPNELFHFIGQSVPITYKGVLLEKDEVATLRAMLEIIIKNKSSNN
ncbi:helix-turn-helix domain-containing protein [Solibacillus sp. NPDC093137]|uniref:helix-turn-helix domain-containing protein n=1 Tax=Solibacillus sp. NPDC093137 TaxID=3390678 RepID=UPI003D003CC5